MTIEKAFKLQITHGVPLTAEDVLERKKTEYHNGQPVSEGHIVLHAFVYHGPSTDELTIVGLHQLDLYEMDPNFSAPKNSYVIPHIQLKQQR
tara:strand:- start:279 stop:554 length:276 start_codon:yes stop_codon:yes gene_type:complete